MDLHALRHTAASWLGLAGVHPAIARDVMRHKSLGMLRLYTHTELRDAAEAVERLPDLSASAWDADDRGRSEGFGG